MKTKINRAGNPVTIGLGTAMHRASALPRHPLDAACRENLDLLTEIRTATSTSTTTTVTSWSGTTKS